MKASKSCLAWYQRQRAAKNAEQSHGSPESSEVGSDEDYETNLAAECTPMDLDFDADMHMDAGKQRSAGDQFSPADAISSAEEMGFKRSVSSCGDGNDTIVEEFASAAQVMGDGDDVYTKVWHSDVHYGSREEAGPYYPFSGEVEWEMAQWLHSLNVPMKKINEFFRLRYASSFF